MDSFLTVVSRLKGKQSLSCNDLTAIENQEYDAIKTLKDSKEKSWPRFLRRKSATSSDESINSINGKSSSEVAKTFDCQLAEVREKLAMLRQQDVEFHKRMHSLSNSIGELAASRSSLNSFTHSETSAASNGVMSDDDDDGDYEEQNSYTASGTKGYENNTGKLLPASFSSEVLDSIPTIKVTSYKRRRSSAARRSLRRSDPTLHESARLFNPPLEPDRHSINLTDHTYFYGSTEEISTLL